MIRILALGDVMGKAGRRCLDNLLPRAKEQFSPDVIIANGENSAGGFGITKKVFDQFTNEFGIDCITMGNHWADKPEVHELIRHTERMVLPANMPNVKDETKGVTVLKSKSGVNFAVANVLGKAFMHGENRCPFATVNKLFETIPERIKVRVVDVHAEATSEKQAMGRFLIGKASLVYGTHSHVPTADERILGAHTGFTTDLGMTGAYDSVIGIRTEAALTRLLTGEKKKFEPAEKDPWMCFIVADIDETSGACTAITRHRWELQKICVE